MNEIILTIKLNALCFATHLKWLPTENKSFGYIIGNNVYELQLGLIYSSKNYEPKRIWGLRSLYS